MAAPTTYTAVCCQCATVYRPRAERSRAVDDGLWHEARLPDHHVHIREE